MYILFIIIGISGIVLLFLWKYVETDHSHVIKKIIKRKSKSKKLSTPEEYRRMAKKCLREKRFLEAEEYYEKAKMLEEK